MLSTRRRTLQAGFSYAIDAIGIFVSFLLAYWIRFSEVLMPAQRGIPPYFEYAKALLVVIPAYLWVFRSYGLYQPGRHIRRVEEIFVILKGVAVGTIFLMALTFLYRGFSYSRVFLVILWIVASIVISLFRYLWIQWLYHVRAQSKDIQRLLVVGANRNARALVEWARLNPHLGHRVEGVLVREKELIGKHLEGAPIVGTVAECDHLIAKLKPDEVIVADANLPREEMTHLLLRCEDGLVSFKVAADLYGIVTSNLDVQYLGSVPLLGFRSLPLDDPWNRILKRLLDIVISILGLGLASPLLIAATAAVKWTDGGPVFFSQERVGQDGKQFMIYKFRTMKVAAERESGPVWAKKDDDRCTPAGRLLRRFNLDELPQLWNVLKGDMSLVGPRPERPCFVDKFRDEIPRYMSRHKVKSGITGWAQVHGLRGNTSLQERIKYDLYYMENWSLLLDLEIFFMTLFAFKNAY